MSGKSDILIAFFSRRGSNFVDGGVAKLKLGNTEVAAEMIRKATGGELFRIATAKAYPEGYEEATAVAQRELRENARPELGGGVEDMERYGRVILGYPNWWGTMPMALFTFLEAYDFKDKLILPFCTNEGSGLGSSEKDIRKLCPGAEVGKGLAIRGGAVRESEGLILDWLRRSGTIA